MKKALRVLLLLLLLVGLAFGILAYDVYSYPGDGSAVDADAAIVLGASIDEDEPSPVFRERIDHAIQLLRAGNVRWIILTGGFPDGSELAEATVAKQYAIRCGVAEDRILSETRSHTTYQNLYYAHELARENGLTTFVVVSDPYHLRRAMRMAEELGLDARASATPTSKLNNAGFLMQETLRNAKFLARHALTPDAQAAELAISAH